MISNKVTELLGSRQQREPGYRLKTYRFLTRFRDWPLSHVSIPNSACAVCGNGDPQSIRYYPSYVKPDFDTRVLPSTMRRRFIERALGACGNCGLVQDFNRPTKEEVLAYLNAVTSKDDTVSEEAYHSYPVPREFTDAFRARFFGKRTARWREYFASHVARPKRVLILRPFFGDTVDFVRREFAPDVIDALEISRNARQTVEDRYPEVRFVDGSPHVYFSGDFTKAHSYDAIFCHHVLVHAASLTDSLRLLQDMLVPGGFCVFIQETNVKFSNPFHLIFAGEQVFHEALNRVFPRVDKITDCEDENPNIQPFSVTGDVSDFVAWA